MDGVAVVAAPAVGVVAVAAVVARRVAAVVVHRVAVVVVAVVAAAVEDVGEVLAAVVAAVAVGLCVAGLGHASGAAGAPRDGRLLRGLSTVLVPINSSNPLLLGAVPAAVAWDSLP